MKNYKGALFLFFSFCFLSCSVNTISEGKNQKVDDKNKSYQKTALGTSNSIFLDQEYITQSHDFALYKAWISLDEAFNLKTTADTSEKYNSNQIQEMIATRQNTFLQELEKEKNLKTYRIADNIYGIQNQIKEMETACLEQDVKELARLVTAFYISKGLVYQKSGTIFMQLIISMSLISCFCLFIILFMLAEMKLKKYLRQQIRDRKRNVVVLLWNCMIQLPNRCAMFLFLQKILKTRNWLEKSKRIRQTA